MWLKIMLSIAMAALTGMTPALREQLSQAARDFRTKAAETKNPYDDILANMLCGILGIE